MVLDSADKVMKLYIAHFIIAILLSPAERRVNTCPMMTERMLERNRYLSALLMKGLRPGSSLGYSSKSSATRSIRLRVNGFKISGCTDQVGALTPCSHRKTYRESLR